MVTPDTERRWLRRIGDAVVATEGHSARVVHRDVDIPNPNGRSGSENHQPVVGGLTQGRRWGVGVADCFGRLGRENCSRSFLKTPLPLHREDCQGGGGLSEMYPVFLLSVVSVLFRWMC